MPGGRIEAAQPVVGWSGSARNRSGTDAAPAITAKTKQADRTPHRRKPQPQSEPGDGEKESDRGDDRTPAPATAAPQERPPRTGQRLPERNCRGVGPRGGGRGPSQARDRSIRSPVAISRCDRINMPTRGFPLRKGRNNGCSQRIVACIGRLDAAFADSHGPTAHRRAVKAQAGIRSRPINSSTVRADAPAPIARLDRPLVGTSGVCAVIVGPRRPSGAARTSTIARLVPGRWSRAAMGAGASARHGRELIGLDRMRPGFGRPAVSGWARAVSWKAASRRRNTRNNP